MKIPLLLNVPLFLLGAILFALSFMSVMAFHYVDVMKEIDIAHYGRLIIRHGIWLLLISFFASSSVAICVRRGMRMRLFIVLLLGPYFGLVLAFIYINIPSTIVKIPVLPVFAGCLAFAVIVLSNRTAHCTVVRVSITAVIVGTILLLYLNPPPSASEGETYDECSRSISTHSISEDVETWLHIRMPGGVFVMKDILWVIHHDMLDIPSGDILDYDSKFSWSVFKKCGQVRVREYQSQLYDGNDDTIPFELPPPVGEWARMWEFRGKRSVQRVEDGWLLGFHAGEWGGSLWWFSPDGKLSYKISNDQIIQFVSMSDGLYAIEGLTHLSASGSILRLTLDGEGRWSVDKLVELHEETPTVALTLKDDMLVVTTSGVFRVKRDGDVDLLLSEAWYLQYPNSVELNKDNCLYVGMSQGVAKWCKGQGRESVKWLVPDYWYLDKVNDWYKKMPNNGESRD